MDFASTPSLWELVECAHIAVRTASELRKLRSVHRQPDMQVLQRAVEFLTQAETGAAFVSGQASQLEAGTLKPFNWATDAYLSTLHIQQPDYQAVRTYLDDIASVLRDVIASQQPAAAALDRPILFFEKLGDVIGSRADQTLRSDAEPTVLD